MGLGMADSGGVDGSLSLDALDLFRTTLVRGGLVVGREFGVAKKAIDLAPIPINSEYWRRKFRNDAEKPKNGEKNEKWRRKTENDAEKRKMTQKNGKWMQKNEKWRGKENRCGRKRKVMQEFNRRVDEGNTCSRWTPLPCCYLFRTA